MQNVWSSLFTRDASKDFGFEIGQKTWEDSSLSIWTMYDAKKKGTDELYAAFALDLKCCSEVQSSLAKSYIKRLKMLKHPNILCYVDSLESDKVIYLVTERVQPLRMYFNDAELTSVQKDSLVSWGLFKLASTLQFLSNDCKLIHNSVCVHSIFVTQAGDWKVGGLEFVVSLAENGLPPAANILQVSGRPHGLERYVAPENKDAAGYGRKSKPWSTDMWGLACLIWETYNSETLTAPANLKATKNIAKSLVAAYTPLIAPPENRPSPDEFLAACRAKQGGFMRNAFVETMQFLEEIQIKESEQKSRFFTKLNESLESFPRDVAKYKILPCLVNAFEFGNAGASVLAPLIKLGKLLDAEDYQRRIVPCVVKMFSSPDRSTRVKLLHQVDEFAEHLHASVVNEKIFPHLTTGFLDTNPAVREATVKAMIHLAPKLNYNNLNVELMKYFAQLQGRDDQSIIRTNTTVCLGKIASYLDAKSRQRILLSAFTRALKDPFPPARISGVLALAGTQQFYHLAEAAQRVVPALAALTVDPEKSVREAAFKAVEGFLAKLKKASENPELIQEMEAQVMAGSGKSFLSSGGSVPSWADWALGALGSKFYKAPPQQAPSAASASHVGPESPSASAAVVAASTAPHASPNAAVAEGAKGAAQTSDGWDDDEEDWGEIDDTTSAAPAASSVRSAERSSLKVQQDERRAAPATVASGWDADTTNDGDDDDGDWGSLEVTASVPAKERKEEMPARAATRDAAIPKGASLSSVSASTNASTSKTGASVSPPFQSASTQRAKPSALLSSAGSAPADVNSDEFFLESIKTTTQPAHSATARRTKPADMNMGGEPSAEWGDVDWGDGAGAETKKSSTARNEQRKQELEQRRQQKQKEGPLKLGARKLN